MATPTARALVLLAGIIVTAACGSSAIPSPVAAPPRESGQSRLIEKTVAGKNRCNPQDHTRPFVVEWDGTDISSFESRANTDVVFVRYEGCNLQVLDGCTNDAIRGSLGAYGPVDWTSGSVEKVDILNEDELYAKLPLGTAVLGARVQGGERFHMEYFVSGTRKATRPAVYRSELDRVPGCKRATHYVYAYNVGAFALGSFSKLEGSAGATLWGAGGGVNSKNQSAIEKQGGVLASCRGESATEVSTCKVPIRLTLREVEGGDNPDAKAAVAPETPDALNLAGKLAASSDRSRAASERLASAQRKLSAGDGKGCLADLDASDRLDPRPGGLSTDAKGSAWLRAQCLMAGGQCDAGRALARRASQAQQPNEAASRIDEMIDWQVAMHCGEGAKTPRDRLLVGLHVLREGAQRTRTTPKACTTALDTAVAALPKVTPRDGEDKLTKNAARSIAEDGTKCLARANDCVTAWKRFPPLLAMWGTAESHDWGTAPERVRDMFESASYGECVGKEQGTLSPIDELARSIEELKWAEGHSTTTATPALCTALIDRGKRALATLRDDKTDFVKYSVGYLRTAGAKCLAKAGDCAASRAHFIASYTSQYSNTTPLRAEEAYLSDSFNGSCNTTLIPGLPAKEAVAHALRVLEASRRGNKSCSEPFEALKKAVTLARSAGGLQEEDESALWRQPLECFDHAAKCDDAWRSLQVTNAWRKKPEDVKGIRSTFTSFAEKCADASINGLTPAEQYWAAHAQLHHAKKTTKEKCIALHQSGKRTASAVSLSAKDSGTDIDVAFAYCLGRAANDCAGAKQALAPTQWASNESTIRYVCPER